jgi:hypothetical protein
MKGFLSRQLERRVHKGLHKLLQLTKDTLLGRLFLVGQLSHNGLHHHLLLLEFGRLYLLDLMGQFFLLLLKVLFF